MDQVGAAIGRESEEMDLASAEIGQVSAAMVQVLAVIDLIFFFFFFFFFFYINISAVIAPESEVIDLEIREVIGPESTPGGDRPGNGGDRPGIGGDRPGIGGDRPGMAATDPVLVVTSGNGGNRPGIGGNRPGIWQSARHRRSPRNW